MAASPPQWVQLPTALLRKVAPAAALILALSGSRKPQILVRKDSVPVTWNPRAKDGADYPEAMRKEATAIRRLTPGEIFDAEWTPRERGEFQLRVGNRTRAFYTRKLIVE